MNVNQMVTVWKNEHTAATAELVALEAALKVAYNQYVDSLVAYIARVKVANDVRESYIRMLDQADVANDNHHLVASFGCSAEAQIENQAVKYLIDRWLSELNASSVLLVRACDAAQLLERKAE